jgi:hypothetical protein
MVKGEQKMQKRFFFIALSILFLVSFVLYVNPAIALNNCPNCAECPNCTDCMDSGSLSRFRNNSNSNMNYQYGASMGPPWASDPDNFSGGPSWANYPMEGSGPWFWQVYNGFEVPNNAPIWYTNFPNEPYPAWLDGSSRGPWWSSYISETIE